MKRYAAFLVLPVFALAVFAGCGGSDDNSSDNAPAVTEAQQSQKPDSAAGDAVVVDLAADPSGALAYDTDSLEAKAGNIAIAFTNDAAIGHDVVIEKDGAEVARGDVITGSSETVAISNAKPGEYTFYCSLPGHREAGMEGTLTVK